MRVDFFDLFAKLHFFQQFYRQRQHHRPDGNVGRIHNQPDKEFLYTSLMHLIDNLEHSEEEAIRKGGDL